ncbi:hypothetical protein HRbin30_00393 [bacterium HR30]|nr:hypothetical protein HRbin30_00393 [bacterium HR30]
MITELRCPYCGASYRLKSEYVPSEPVRFRCRHCQRTFPYVSKEPKRKTTISRSQREEEERTPSLIFKARENPPGPSETVAQDDEGSTESEVLGQAQPPDTDGNAQAGAAKQQRKVGKGRSADNFNFIEDEFFVEPEPTPDEEGDWSRPDETKRKPYNKGRGTKLVVRHDDRGQFRTLVFLVLAAVAFYAVLTGSLFARPDRAEAFVTRIPLIGQGVGEERLWAQRVRLEEVEAVLQETKDGRPALVISGKAVNTATSPLQAVQLSAELLRGDGKVTDQKTIFVGNMVSARVLRDLTPQEISILQQLSPPRQFAVAPGEAAPFAIVFFFEPSKRHEPQLGEESKLPSEFRLRVVAARRQG